jgi:hypothetical protein
MKQPGDWDVCVLGSWSSWCGVRRVCGRGGCGMACVGAKAGGEGGGRVVARLVFLGPEEKEGGRGEQRSCEYSRAISK